jgi:MoaA/NifB/PqqE/SkfB family radical SAM enzyme
MRETLFWLDECCKWLKGPGLDSLVLYVTSRCNAGCEFCCYHNNLNQGPELSLDEIESVARKLGSLRGLLIAGGEPFLRTHLAEIVLAFVHHSHTQVVQIPTNGYFPDRAVECVKKILAAAPGLNLSIQVSLDALGETHNELRRLKDGFVRAEETIRKLGELKRHDNALRILVVSVLSPQTLPYARALATYVRDDIKPDYHWFEPVRGGHLADSLRTALDNETRTFLRKNLGHYLYRSCGRSTSIYSSRSMNKMITAFSLNNFDIAYNNLLAGHKWPVRCRAGEKIAVLYPDASLALCELLPQRVNLRDQAWDIPRALGSEQFSQSFRAIRRHECDCTHGCFIPPSVRYSAPELGKILLKGLWLDKRSIDTGE